MPYDLITKKRLILYNALKRFKNKSLDSNDKNVINKIICNIRDNKTNHYLSIPEDSNKISYAINKQDKFNDKKRVVTTFGRYIRRKIGIDSSEFDDGKLSKLSEFVSIYIEAKRTNAGNVVNKIEILSGNDILDFYIKSNRTIHTCMTGRLKSHITEFYAINPGKVYLVITKNKKARALLWITDGGKRVLDQVYPNSGKEYNMIKAWARYSKLTKPNKTHRITLNHNNYFPYMDTFKFGMMKDKTIVLSINHSFKKLSLTSVNGFYFT